MLVGDVSDKRYVAVADVLWDFEVDGQRSTPNPVLLAKGTNRDEGGAEIVYYETGSGGAVFSVGSITDNASILVVPTFRASPRM